MNAERHTSSVAEINAVVEALLWWASVAEPANFSKSVERGQQTSGSGGPASA